MSNNISEKNPISIINEYCLRTNSKVAFDFSVEGTEFIARVLFNGEVIGEGKDKKKQAAKTKAAEAAVAKLSSQNVQKKESNGLQLEKELGSILIKLGKKGSYRLSFQDPLYVYQYFIAENLIAEGKCVTEPSAKIKCTKKVVNKLKPFVDKLKVKDNSDAPNSVPNPSSDKINASYLSSLNSKTKSFIDSKIASFELSPLDKKQIFDLEEEIHSLSKKLGLKFIPIGSLSINLIRSSNKLLDYCIILENISEPSILSIAESIQKAINPYPDLKDSKSSTKLEICNSDSSFYSKNVFIRISKDGIQANLFFYESNLHPSAIHYKALGSGILKSGQLLTCALLRQWKRKLNLLVPVELLDLLVMEYTVENQEIYIMFRAVLELLAGGIYLPGSSRVERNTHHEFLVNCWPLKNRYLVMAEALKSLISFSQADFSFILT